uniref:Pepsin-I3 domain-containing protein n=1 Tax=Anisakis simplex TaxID=6269 RepID=A0A0M3JAH0_ANISI
LTLWQFSNCIFLYGSSTGPFVCKVVGDQVFLANLPWAKVQDSDKAAAEEYMKRYDNCMNVVHQMTPDCLKPPEFCSPSVDKMFNFAGCVVLGNKVFSDMKYLHDLTPDQQTQLNGFIEKQKEYDAAQTKFQTDNANNPE